MPIEYRPDNDQEDVVEEYSFDDLARGIANGTLSRPQALKLIVRALLGGILLILLPGVAEAGDGCGGRCRQRGRCCKGRCVNTDRNENHCGKCNNRCRANQTCCNGACVNLDNNEDNCGACGNVCSQSQVCREGTCVSTCDPATCEGCCDPSGVCVPFLQQCPSGGTCVLDPNTEPPSPVCVQE